MKLVDRDTYWRTLATLRLQLEGELRYLRKSHKSNMTEHIFYLIHTGGRNQYLAIHQQWVDMVLCYLDEGVIRDEEDY